MRKGDRLAIPRAHLGAIALVAIAVQPLASRAATVTWSTSQGGNGHAYELVETPVNWRQAREAAALRPPPTGFLFGQLASIASAAENAFLALSFVSGTRTGAWIGFTDEAVEGEWRWLDGTPGIWQDPRSFPSPVQTAYTNWIPGEPNDFATGEDYCLFSCEAGYYPGQWNDGNGPTSGVPFSYIVEYAPVPEPSALFSLLAGATVGTWLKLRRRQAGSMSTSLVVLLALTPSVTSAQNLVHNGSFELPFASSGIISITPSLVPAGFQWSVEVGSVEVTRQNYLGGTSGNLPFLGPAADGFQWLDLDGEGVRGGPGALSQVFHTSSGSEYTLNFSYSSNPYRNYSGEAQATVSVFDATSQTALISPFRFTHGNSTASDFDWRHAPAATFVAMSGSTVLRFASNNPSDSDAGIFLDAISVTAVPEPALCLAMALVAACGCMMLRGRRRNRAAIAHGLHTVLMLVILALPASTTYAVNYELVTVGDAGNAPDTTGYGAVPYEYKIGKYEVTIGQYATFLNSVAATSDDYGLYDFQLGQRISINGIAKNDVDGVATYTPQGPFGDNPYAQSAGNRPVSYMTWFTAARFANWMANGQPSGPPGALTTEDGVYPLNGATSGTAPARNSINPNTGSAPTWWIPTENEWYKAAYFSPVLNSGSGGYYMYATQSDNAPGNRIGASGNQANGIIFVGNPGYLFSTRTSPVGYVAANFNQNYLTDVGAFTGSQSFYGTFDQNGNVWEWNDLDGQAGTFKGFRGGNWDYDSASMRSTIRYQTFARGEDFWSSNGQYYGLRLAAAVAVPEPTTGLTFAGLSLVGWLAARRTRLL